MRAIDAKGMPVCVIVCCASFRKQPTSKQTILVELVQLFQQKQYNILKDSQIAKLVGITKNSVTSIRNKSYWNYNNLNAKDPVALNLFSQKELLEAIEKAERRIKRERKEKEKKNNQVAV